MLSMIVYKQMYEKEVLRSLQSYTVNSKLCNYGDWNLLSQV